MKKIGALVALVTFLTVPTLHARRLTDAEKRTLRVKPAVVLVVVPYQYVAILPLGKKQLQWKGSGAELGSGFLFRPDGYLITNGHVVELASASPDEARNEAIAQIKQDLLGGGDVFQKVSEAIGRALTDEEKGVVAKSLQVGVGNIQLKVVLSNGKAYDADIKAFSPSIVEKGKDVSVIKIDATDLPTVPLGDSESVKLQDPITVIGYPGAASPLNFSLIGVESMLEQTVTDGTISALKFDNKGTPVLQSNALIAHGNSGGPAFNQGDQVIGIATFGTQEEHGFNFFVPINTAMEFVRQAGATPESGLFDKAWNRALDAYDQGSCSSAIADLDHVLTLVPNQPDAIRLRKLAEECPGPPWTIIVTGGVVGVLIIATAIWFLVHRRSVAGVVVAAPAGGPGARTQIEGQYGALPPSAPPVLPEKSFGSIQCTSGALSGKRFPISKQGLLIGRDSSKCAVVLSDDAVSKEHAWIVPLDDSVYVIDRGSTNGVFVNSVDSPKVSKVRLQHGDRIFIGKGVAVFTYLSS